MLVKFLAEFVGTFMLILLGDGVVANVTLNKSGMKGAGSIQITLAWGLAVMVPAFIFGAASGAHFNPALTIALAVDSGVWNEVPIYILAQFAGAFVGACLVFILFKDQFDATDDPGTKLGVFSCGPSIPNMPLNFVAEVVATFVLVFAIKGIPNTGIVFDANKAVVADMALAGVNNGLGKLFVFGIIVSIGMSLGGLTGYALNPARDIGPRMAHAVLPIKGKGSSNWPYAIVTLLGPIVGAVLAVLVYKALGAAGVWAAVA